MVARPVHHIVHHSAGSNADRQDDAVRPAASDDVALDDQPGRVRMRVDAILAAVGDSVSDDPHACGPTREHPPVVAVDRAIDHA